jgi:hypothetical protein
MDGRSDTVRQSCALVVVQLITQGLIWAPTCSRLYCWSPSAPSCLAKYGSSGTYGASISKPQVRAQGISNPAMLQRTGSWPLRCTCAMKVIA